MTTTPARSFSPDWTVEPGETIADLLDEKDMTQTQLAQRLGVSLKHVNQIVKGSASISPALALGLEKVLGPTATFWLNREAQHQATLARLRELESFDDMADWASQFPIAELKKTPYFNAGARGNHLVDEVLRFFGIASPSQWVDPCVAFRKTQAYESDRHALSAWLRVGEIEAQTIPCAAYDQDRFLDVLESARGMTRLPPSEWQPKLEKSCAAAGVAVVVVDTFAKARANGATRWITPGKALIQLSLRYRWEDIFWFTFFHEAAHVVLHRKKDVFVDRELFIETTGRRGDSPTDPGEQKLEAEADRFAARTLIPARYERRLPDLRLADIPAFADQLGIAPAIVVGRMQHEGRLPYNQGNHLRHRFSFK